MRCAVRLALSAAIAISIIGCSSDEAEDSGPPLVVEAYLYVGHPFGVVVSNLAGVTVADVDNLSLSIWDGEQAVSLNAIGDGTYTSSEDVVVKDGDREYTLRFMHDNKEIHSLSVVPFKPVGFTLSKTEITVEPRTGGPMGGIAGGIQDDIIELHWNNAQKDYYFPVFESIEDNPELINTNLDTIGGNAPRAFFRGEPTQENSSQMRPIQFQYYGRYNVILFHVNPDYAALYKEQDNSSSLNLQPPFTNVVNGLGIFTALHSDTILLTVNKP